MSSSIRIPARSYGHGESSSKAAATSASSSASSYSSSPRTPPQNAATTPSSTATTSTSPPSSTSSHYRKNSYLSDAFSQQDYTIINIGDPDGVPRLITYMRASQGYEWNPEIFLPSYIDFDYESFEMKRDPVHEIRLSDEEAKQMFPE